MKAGKVLGVALLMLAVGAGILQAGPAGQWHCRSTDGCIVCQKLYQLENMICVEVIVTCPTYDDWAWVCY